MDPVRIVAQRCRLDAGFAEALLAAADGDVETAISIHLENGGELADEDEFEALGDAEAVKGSRPDDAEAARVAAAAAAAAAAAGAGGGEATGPPEPLVSALALPTAPGARFAPVARVNIDGVDGSSIPGGLHLARYGGGDDYRQVDPLLSVWLCGSGGAGEGAGEAAGGGEAAETSAWRAAAVALPRVTAASLQLLHGFGMSEVMPGGRAPQPAALRLEPRPQLVVSRLPSAGTIGGAHVSLMLHGWLFASFAKSGRKAHQKFPLFLLSGAVNLAQPPAQAPEWLPLPDEAEAADELPPPAAVGYADQHVHKDEPVDLGGFLFAEVFFGSDMARVAPADAAAPAAVWAVGVDSESERALAVLAVLLPAAAGGAEAEAEAALEAAVRAAAGPAEVGAALRARWGAAADRVAAELDGLQAPANLKAE